MRLRCRARGVAGCTMQKALTSEWRGSAVAILPSCVGSDTSDTHLAATQPHSAAVRNAVAECRQHVDQAVAERRSQPEPEVLRRMLLGQQRSRQQSVRGSRAGGSLRGSGTRTK